MMLIYKISYFAGPKIVSRTITVESIQELISVIKRKPIIWDNLHANDYDQTRVFFGPYQGRSPELKSFLKGILTNPNCEFEANYVAMHTLGSWSKFAGMIFDSRKKNGINSKLPCYFDSTVCRI